MAATTAAPAQPKALDIHELEARLAADDTTLTERVDIARAIAHSTHYHSTEALAAARDRARERGPISDSVARELVDALKSDDGQVAAFSCMALAVLLMNPPSVDTVVRAGGVDALVDFARKKDTMHVAESAWAIGNIAREQGSAIAASDAAAALVDMITARCPDAGHVCWGLWGLEQIARIDSAMVLRAGAEAMLQKLRERSDMPWAASSINACAKAVLGGT